MQIRRENNRTLNRVLYTQLDVWHTVLAADARPVAAALSEIVAKKFALPKAQLHAMFSDDRLSVLMKQLMPSTLSSDLEFKYQKAVDALADVNPLLAFQLNGRPELTRYAGKWRSNVETWLQQIRGTDTDRELLTSFEPILEDKARSRVLNSLEADILDVAILLGKSTRKRISKTLAKAREGPDDVVKADVANVLDQILRAAVGASGTLRE